MKCKHSIPGTKLMSTEYLKIHACTNGYILSSGCDGSVRPDRVVGVFQFEDVGEIVPRDGMRWNLLGQIHHHLVPSKDHPEVEAVSARKMEELGRLIDIQEQHSALKKIMDDAYLSAADGHPLRNPKPE